MLQIGFRPIFVVGAQRSGTTFLAERLGRMEGVIATPEAQVIKRLIALGADPLPAAGARAAAQAVRDDFRFWTLGIRFEGNRMTTLLREGGGFALARALLETCRDNLSRTGADVWVEHSPENLLDLPWLLHKLPEARAIHIVRDGRGVLASLRHLDWGPHSARRVADYWLAAAMTGAALSASRPERVITVRYEDILSDEAAQLERLAAFAGVCRAGADDSGGASFELPAFTRDQHRLVGGAPVRDRAGAWRAELSPRDQAIFEHFAGVGLNHFGYMPDSVPAAFRYGTRDATTDYLRDGWKLIRSKLRQAAFRRRFVRSRQRSETPDEGAR